MDTTIISPKIHGHMKRRYEVGAHNVLLISSLISTLVEFLTVILGRKCEVKHIQDEETIRSRVYGKEIRMDVVIEGLDGVYDIEMQSRSEPHLDKRYRLYQSNLDMQLTDRGDKTAAISPTYIIFICKNDPYGLGLPKYTIERGFVEEPGKFLATDAHWMALNASAWNKANGRLSELLHYIKDGSVGNDSLVQSINSSVLERNMDPKRKAEMMKYVTGHMLDSELDKAEGRAEGRAEINKLTEKLINDNRLEELKRSYKDKELQQQLLVEYGLA